MGLLSDIFGYGDIKGSGTKTVTNEWADYIKGLNEDTLAKSMSVSLGGGEATPFISGSQRYAQNLLEEIAPKTVRQTEKTAGPSLLQSIGGVTGDLLNTGLGGLILYNLITGKGAGSFKDILGGTAAAKMVTPGAAAVGAGAGESGGLLTGLTGSSGSVLGGDIASLAASLGIAPETYTAMLGSSGLGTAMPGTAAGEALGLSGGAEAGGLLSGLTGTGGTEVGAGLTGGSALGAIGGGLLAAPVLGPMITPIVGKFMRGLVGNEEPIPSAYRYLQAYVRGEGIPEFDISAEEVQKIDPQQMAQNIAYQRQTAGTMGSDIGPSAGADYTYPGMTIGLDADPENLGLGTGYSYTVPGEQNISRPEDMIKSAVTSGSLPSKIDINVWNQAVAKAERINRTGMSDEVNPWNLYRQMMDRNRMP